VNRPGDEFLSRPAFSHQEACGFIVRNFLDGFARYIGLGFPGGPKIYGLSLKSKNYIELPYVVKGMDLSFSGLYTAAKRLIESERYQKDYNLNDVAYSLQETAFSMLTEVTERALAHTEKNEVLMTGGVAANKRLQEMIGLVSEDHGARFEAVPLKFAGDNGVMIGWAGILRYKATGGHSLIDTIINPKERMDQVTIPWRE